MDGSRQCGLGNAQADFPPTRMELVGKQVGFDCMTPLAGEGSDGGEEGVWIELEEDDAEQFGWEFAAASIVVVGMPWL